MNVDATLTRAELAAPFAVFDFDFEVMEGPMRTALEIEDIEIDDGGVAVPAFRFTDRDLAQSEDPISVTVLPKDNH